MSGEGFELQRVERVLSASDILHRVLSPAALAEETEDSEKREEETEGGRGSVCRKNEREKNKSRDDVWRE